MAHQRRATRDHAEASPSTLLVGIVSILLLTLPAAPITADGGSDPITGEDDLQIVPEVVDGFTLAPLAASPFPTALAFDPAGDLFVTLISGQVLEYDLLWTDGGPVAQDVDVFATGFNQPLGLTFDDDGNLYVADSHRHPNADVAHVMGRVWRVDATTEQPAVIVDGLPGGQHTVNHLRFGPDGLLYMPNGNPNDHGNGTGTGQADVFPYSGAFLAIDVNGIDPDLPDTTPSSPAILHWEDGTGTAIAPGDVVDHPLNDPFEQQVDVFAYGFRNIFGIAFAPDDLPFGGAGYTGMNGADDPASQDSVYKITEDAHHGYPFCYNAGDPGATGADVSKIQNPDSPNDQFDCTNKPVADALLGWHICATGVDFATDPAPGRPDASFPEDMRKSLFVGECGFFFAHDTVVKTAEDKPSTHNTGHKVARVPLDDSGEATAVEDFVTGLQLPTDVRFGPDGAMYIADVDMLYRVAPTTAETPEPPELPVTVGAVGQSFLPQAIVVPTGTPVTWLSGPLPHTVTTTDQLCTPFVDPASCDGNDKDNTDGDPDTFHATLGGVGDTHTHAFSTQGVHTYNCQLHYPIGMVGLVVAVDTSPTIEAERTPFPDAVGALEGVVFPGPDGDAPRFVQAP